MVFAQARSIAWALDRVRAVCRANNRYRYVLLASRSAVTDVAGERLQSLRSRY